MVNVIIKKEHKPSDKLRSYKAPIKNIYSKSTHISHKSLNNWGKNAHQPTGRKEKILIKFKNHGGAQIIISLMSKIRNIFALELGRYTKKLQFPSYLNKPLRPLLISLFTSSLGEERTSSLS